MDHDHPASEASYQNLFSLADGVLVADFNYSPDYQIKLNELDVTAPALTQWSDIVFLDWQELHHQAGSSEEQKRKIQHFLRIKIRNEETVSTARAARNGGVRTGGQERPPGVSTVDQASAKVSRSTANVFHSIQAGNGRSTKKRLKPSWALPMAREQLTSSCSIKRTSDSRVLIPYGLSIALRMKRMILRCA